jgi:hypothetical protein
VASRRGEFSARFAGGEETVASRRDEVSFPLASGGELRFPQSRVPRGSLAGGFSSGRAAVGRPRWCALLAATVRVPLACGPSGRRLARGSVADCCRAIRGSPACSGAGVWVRRFAPIHFGPCADLAGHG